MLNLKQNKIQFDHEGNLVNLHTFNFIRDLQNEQYEERSRNDTVLCVQILGSEGFTGISLEMENNLFLSNSEFKNQGIFPLVNRNMEHLMQNDKQSR